MDVTIYSIIPKCADIIRNSLGDEYVRILRKPSKFEDTVDIAITVCDIAVCKSSFVIGTPDGEDYYLPFPSDTYHKIEVM